MLEDASQKLNIVWPYLLRLFTAILCGGLVGFERKLQKKDAGINTHIVVALGMALIMIVNKYGFYDMMGQLGIKMQVSQMAGNAITGIGFLCSGIIVFNNAIRGLTTAAGVFATAGIGLTAGAGMYGTAIAATALLLVIQTIVRKLMPTENVQVTEVRLTLRNEPGAMRSVQAILKEKGIKATVKSLEKKQDKIKCTLVIKFNRAFGPEDLSPLFEGCPCLISASL